MMLWSVTAFLVEAARNGVTSCSPDLIRWGGLAMMLGGDVEAEMEVPG
jgi:hypothetical protein